MFLAPLFPWYLRSSGARCVFEASSYMSLLTELQTLVLWVAINICSSGAKNPVAA